jgi:hypothetical protein
LNEKSRKHENNGCFSFRFKNWAAKNLKINFLFYPKGFFFSFYSSFFFSNFSQALTVTNGDLLSFFYSSFFFFE